MDYSNIYKSLKDNGMWIGNIASEINTSDLFTDEFKATWDTLEQDLFMADGGKYRYRRFSEFHYNNSGKSLAPQPHSYFIQSKKLNYLNGGVKRFFHPLTPYVAMNQDLHQLIIYIGEIISNINNTNSWKLYTHQVKIKTTKDQKGKPTPEGIHKDGMTFSVLLVINRENVIGGENRFYDNEKTLIKEVSLLKQYDCAIFDDRQGYHSVTDIFPKNPKFEGVRNMLFLEFSEYVS